MPGARDELIANMLGLLDESVEHRKRFQDAQKLRTAAYRAHERARAELAAVSTIQASSSKEYEWKLDHKWYARPELVALTEAVDAAEQDMAQEKEEIERCLTEIQTIGLRLSREWIFGTP